MHLSGQTPLSTIETALIQLTNKAVSKEKTNEQLVGVFESRDERQNYLTYSQSSSTFEQLDLQSIAAQINSSMYLLGMREPLAQGLLMSNAAFLKEMYPTMTIPRFQRALALSMAGRLEPAAQHFGTWTPTYISQILNAYIAQEQKAIMKVRYKESLQEPTAAKPEPYELALRLALSFFTVIRLPEELETKPYDGIELWKFQYAYNFYKSHYSEGFDLQLDDVVEWATTMHKTYHKKEQQLAQDLAKFAKIKD